MIKATELIGSLPLLDLAGYLLVFLLLLRGLMRGLVRHYGPFYIYVAFVLISSTLQMAMLLSYGHGSGEYRRAYEIPTYIMPLLQLSILWDLYGRLTTTAVGAREARVRLILVAMLLTSPIFVAILTAESANLFVVYHSLTLFLQMALCLLLSREAVRVRHELDLGQNLRGILVGMSLLVGCQTINFVAFVLLESPLLVFKFFVQFIYFGALIVFVHSLWDYAPLRRTDGVLLDRLEKVNREVYESVKAVLFNKR